MQINENCEKIAIMGGTFDPIHYGHLASAEAVRYKFGFEKVIFIPSGSPPHKSDRIVTNSETRYLMLSAAVTSNGYFDVSRIEIDRVGESFTYDTIISIKRTLPYTAKIYFITGADALFEILSWRSATELLKECSFIAITRPGYENEDLQNHVKYLKNQLNANIFYLEVPSFSLSSTDIRNKVNVGEPIKYLVPEPVEELIYKYGLYKSTEGICTIYRK